MTTSPGPADEPSRDGGDLIDLTDYGGGRWRLCLTEPSVEGVESSAWCVWSPDRSAVIEVLGLPSRSGAIDYDASVSFARSEFQLSTTDRGRGGLVATYVPDSTLPAGDVADDWRAGRLAFDVALVIDPESGAPVGAPPRRAESMRWMCGDPPPPR